VLLLTLLISDNFHFVTNPTWSKPMIRSQTLAVTGLVIGFLLTFSSAAMSSDSDRITQLEKEVQDLKIRLTSLELPPNKTNANNKPTVSAEGWKNLANWRSLKNGMTYDEVRATLGEPARIAGGNIAFWYYPNRSDVTFYQDRVHSWSEPR
jgi:hypothetical protein